MPYVALEQVGVLERSGLPAVSTVVPVPWRFRGCLCVKRHQSEASESYVEAFLLAEVHWTNERRIGSKVGDEDDGVHNSLLP